jgi:hypothetical protein
MAGIANSEPVKPPTDDEQVNVGNFVRRLPPRGCYPYSVREIDVPY